MYGGMYEAIKTIFFTDGVADDWRGELDYQYFGPQLYVTVRF